MNTWKEYPIKASKFKVFNKYIPAIRDREIRNDIKSFGCSERDNWTSNQWIIWIVNYIRCANHTMSDNSMIENPKKALRCANLIKE